MTDVTPIRVVIDGSGDTTGLSEFQSGETLGLSHGGTGATTAGSARTNLGLSAIAASGSWTDLLNKPDTDSIPEGSANLYYADSRVQSYLTANSYTDQSYVNATVNAAVSNLLDGAPGVLDTLNELAAAIGDDANFITTITNQISAVQSNVDNLTTTNIPEGTNLYYTNERVDDRVADLIVDGVGISKSYDDAGNLLNISINFTEFDTDDIIEGSVNTFLNTRTTSDLTEGTNLYYTDERVDDRVSALITAGSNITATYSDLYGTLTLNVDNTGGFDLANNTTDDLSEGSNRLYYTTTRVNSAFDTRLATKSTTDLTEGSNLYFTNARVTSVVNTLNFASETYVDNADNTLQLQINSNDGDITAIQSSVTAETNRATVAENTLTTNLSTEVTRAQGAENTLSSDLDDEVFDREQGDAALQLLITGIAGTLNTDIISEGSTNLYYTQARFDSAFTAKSTTDLSEGTNLYYTDARVRSHVEGQDLNLGTNKILFSNMYATTGDLPNATSYHGMFAHVHATGKGYFAHAGSWIKLLDESSSTTTDITEGTNLYYTDARARASISVTGDLTYNSSTGVISTQGLASSTTDDLAEGSTNLYYTAARDTAQFNTDLATKSTTNLAEGTNLYFTNARVQTKLGDVSGHIIPDTDVTYDLGSSTHKFRDLYLSGSSIILGTIELRDNGGVLEQIPVGGGTTLTYATQTYVTTQIANLVDTAPTTLDTLNELAAALGDDPNFATTITNSIATKLATADFTSTADSWLTTKTTTDLNEGTNLYYTDARVDARITATNPVTNIGELGDVNLTTAAANGQTLVWDNANSEFIAGDSFSQSDFNTAFTAKSTTDLSEGTNLYYTDARVRNQIYVSAIVTTSAGDFYIDGVQQVTLSLQPGRTYRFDQSAASNNSHPLRFSTVSDGTHAGGGATEYTTGVTANGTAGNAGAYVEIVVTNATPSLYYYCANHSGMGGSVGVGRNSIVDSITSSSWITGPIQTSTVNVGTGGSISATLGTVDFTNSTVVFSGATVNGLSNSDVGLANIADNAQGVVVTGKVAADSLDIGTGGSINAVLTTVDFSSSTVVFSSATVNGLGGTINDQVDFHLNQSSATSNQVLSWNGTDYAWVTESAGPTDTDSLPEGSTNLYLTTARVTTIVNAAMASSTLASDLDDEIFDRETADADLQTQISAISTYSAFDTDFAAKSTTDLSEGTNLYYTQARFDTAFTAKSTANLTENTNLYYTQARFDTALTAKSTTDLSEGTNLYFTEARVLSYLGVAAGHIIPDTNVTYDLGSTTHRFRDLFLSGSSISLGDATLSSEVGGAMVLPTGSKMATTPTSTTNSTIIATTAFVNTAVAALVDTAPATLDTLNELAASINDDANYAATVTTALSLKFNISDYNSTFDTQFAGKSTTDLSEGTNFYYTAARDTAQFNTDFATKTTANLTENTNLYYTDARVRTHLIGQDLDLGVNNFITTGKMLYANMYATTGDLPSATTYHGMFAHVHGTGKGYFAHGGNWVELANNSQIIAQDFTWTSLTGTPTTIAGYGITDAFDGAFGSLTATPTTIAGYGITDAFDGTYASLSGAPTIPTSIDNLTDVDISTTAPTVGQTLVWDNANSKFIPGAASAAGYDDAAVDTHLNQSNPTSGYVLSWNGSDYAWVAQSGGGGGGGSSVTVSDSAPSSPSEGDMWFNSLNTKLYVYFNDGTSTQWIQSNPSGAVSPIVSSDTAPANPVVDSLWFDSTDAVLYYRYSDGTSEQWVDLGQSITSSGGGGSSVNTWVEKSAAYTVVAGEKLFVDCSSATVTVTLPASATLGDEIRIVDATGNAATNNITIDRNGHTIQGAATDLTIATNRAAFGLAYYNVAQGWILTER